MSTERLEVSRRVFLCQTGAAGLAVSLASTRGDASPEDKGGSAPKGVKSRKLLAEPGPMLPPVPAVFLTVCGAPSDPDEISVVWSFVLNGKPPQVGISVGDEHVAGKLVSLHRQFALNVPSAAIVREFDIVDMNSSKVMDKYKLSGLTRGKATKIDAPTVEEAPIQLECKVLDTLRVPPARTLFVAEVVAVTVHPSVCDEKGRLKVADTPFFGMTAGSGEFYTMGRRVGHIGQSVGRNDIKY